MDVVFDDDFWTRNERTLKRPNLACLTLDARTYKTLLMQINGEIGYDKSGIWLVEKDIAKQKFSDFFNKAIQENVELAITPEYSCPWDSLIELLDDQKFPGIENLWLIGMQSIRPDELLNILKDRKEVTWIVDEDLVNEKLKSHANGFFDPVCKLLNTVDSSGKNHKVIIVQFKNYPFGGGDADWERDNLILGKTFYVIKNQQASSQLVTLICSDTLKTINFNEVNDKAFLPIPMLIIHIQLNQKPFADNYKQYRNLLFSKGDKDWFKEVICLNWARGVTYKVKEKSETFNEIGGSAFYLKSTKLVKKDTTINANHKHGLYYTSWETKRTHAYFLNYDEYVFLIENTKPSQMDADPAQHNRSGPRSISTFKWGNTDWKVQENRICDGFQITIKEVEEEPGILDCLSKNENYIDTERMIQLSSGEIIVSENWFMADKMLSFNLGDNEINNRVLFSQLADPIATKDRHRKIQAYSVLKHSIITDSKNLPIGFENPVLLFSDDAEKHEKYLLNLYSKNKKLKATAIYLANTPSSQAITFQKQIADLFKDSHQGKLVMVWHEGNKGRIRYPEILPTPKIKENVTVTSDKINKKRKR